MTHTVCNNHVSLHVDAFMQTCPMSHAQLAAPFVGHHPVASLCPSAALNCPGRTKSRCQQCSARSMPPPDPQGLAGGGGPHAVDTPWRRVPSLACVPGSHVPAHPKGEHGSGGPEGCRELQGLGISRTIGVACTCRVQRHKGWVRAGAVACCGFAKQCQLSSLVAWRAWKCPQQCLAVA